MNRLAGPTALGIAALVVLAAGCGDDDVESASPPAGSSDTAAASDEPESGEHVTLRLGYFPNVTHATALVGVEGGLLAESLGDNVTLETSTFNAGGEAVQALFTDAVDATYIGPNPAINGFAKSEGEALRIVSGATSGGAFLVVKPEITSPADLADTTIATPALGNTQDVALRAWLRDKGLSADESGGGDVSIRPQENGATLDSFKAGDIDGAWVPEPWATRLIQEGGGTVLVDERDLWPDGQYVTTHLIVSTKFLDEHPDVVKRLLQGHVAATDFVNANPEESQRLVNDGIEAITQKRMNDEVLAGTWTNLTFTTDPIASSLQKSADDAIAIGLLDDVDLTGIYALDLLNEVLAEAGQPTVTGL
ncbi:MAG TPA: aliphatic sulfonate ABC transporter substrate-binding protein [Ilumatobacteraceae bacterium]|nr:aliphatic sulfonate ABC transporter substrate-binding protein [Ilumatobacteraceae bacterium]